jgi:hypothetical protein
MKRLLVELEAIVEALEGKFRLNREMLLLGFLVGVFLDRMR